MSIASVLQTIFGTQARFAAPAALTTPADFRIHGFQPSDRDSCLQIYRQNEPGNFPLGVIQDFDLFLTRQDYLKLVCCLNGKVAAVGGVGLMRRMRSTTAWLVFGLVDPSLHKRGIGTALLLARLSALRRPERPVRLLLSNVPGSVGFFARFGFQLQSQMPVRPSGQLIDVCSAMLDAETWGICRGVVAMHLHEISSLEVPLIDVNPHSPNNRRSGP